MQQGSSPTSQEVQQPAYSDPFPTLSTSTYWLGKFPAYALPKYGMTMVTLAVAEEFRKHRIAANTLWLRTLIATEAVRFMRPEHFRKSRKPAIMADAAYSIVMSDSRATTCRSFLDEDRLREEGLRTSCGIGPSQTSNPCPTC